MNQKVRELLIERPELIDVEIEFWTKTHNHDKSDQIIKLQALKDEIKNNKIQA